MNSTPSLASDQLRFDMALALTQVSEAVSGKLSEEVGLNVAFGVRA